MNTVLIPSETELQKRIYTFRSVQVMLDRDLAELYGVKPIRLREQVKRNSKRFPEDFMFQLTDEEVEFLLSQNAIPSRKHLGGALPYVFTEQGVAGISGVLTSERAIEVNIAVLRAFVEMRRYIDDSVLMQLSKRSEGVSATILTKAISKQLTQDLKKHNTQYPPITIREFAYSHDRFLILDGEMVYHLGASLKDLGKKWFAFSKMDKAALMVMERVEKIMMEDER